jgi:hypothetical protein
MSRIIIAAPSYNPSIGGSIALHRLCDILLRLGYDAYLHPTIKLNGDITTFDVNTSYKYQIATEIDPDQDIAIYPEIEPSNPFECKKVVRYILNKFHLPEYDNTISTWEDSDFWIYYHDLFYDNIKEKNILTILDSKLDLYKDYGLDRNIEACFTYRKNSHRKDEFPIVHPKDAIEIGFNVGDQELINIFNSCKTFYSYDTETYLNTIAALCGCTSIIVPDKSFTEKEIENRRKNLGITFGVAYGIDDIENSNKTKHLLREHFEKQETDQFIETMNIFTKIYNHFNLPTPLV